MRRSASLELDAQLGRQVFDSAPVGLSLASRDCRILRVNRTFSKFIGYSARELRGMTIQQITHPDDWPASAKEIDRVWKQAPNPRQIERRYLHKNGKIVWGEVNAGAILDQQGKIKFYVALVTDITERKRAEAGLWKSEEQFRIVFRHAVDGILVTTADGKIVMVNQAFATMHGYTPEEMAHVDFRALDTPESARMAPERIQRLLAGEEMTFEVEHFCKNGGTISLEVSATKTDFGGEVHLFGFHRDITDRKRAEEALRKSNDELERRIKERTARLRALAAELTHAEYKERRRIADVLHEDLQQCLVAIRYGVDGPREREKGSAARNAKWVLDQLDRSIELTRCLTTRICPPALYELGLKAALEWLATDMKARSGLAVSISGKDPSNLADDDMRAFAFWAVSELLTNVVKHAAVKAVLVRMRGERRKRMIIEVVDEGRGFDPTQQAQATQFGLFSIRERAEALGGLLEVTSRPGKGTRVALALPLGSGATNVEREARSLSYGGKVKPIRGKIKRTLPPVWSKNSSAVIPVE